MNVLAIDGGGVRGIVPATILDRWDTEGDRKVQERFQLFAGASTGAIVAGALAAGVSAARLLELFQSETAAIFTPQPEGFFQRALSFKGLVFPAYSAAPLRTALERDLGDLTLGDCPRPLVIASFDVVSGNPKIFRSGHFKEGAGDRSVKLVDAILASAAAPVLFPSVRVGGSTYVDGSLWANNPALLAMIEAGSLSDEPANILSLGCGRPRWGGKLGFGGNRGLLGWGMPLIPLVMTAQSDGVNFYMRRLTGQDRFLRIDPVLPRRLASIEKASNLPELQTRAAEAAREAVPKLNERF